MQHEGLRSHSSEGGTGDREGLGGEERGGLGGLQ